MDPQRTLCLTCRKAKTDLRKGRCANCRREYALAMEREGRAWAGAYPSRVSRVRVIRHSDLPPDSQLH